jgi:hypothetical protein
MRPLFPAAALAALIAIGGVAPDLASAETLPVVPYSSSWRVLDNGTDQTPAALPAATNFASPAFVETAAWRTETIQPGKLLGYGDNSRATLPTQTPNLGYGPSSTNKYITTYFRSTFTVADPGDVVGLALDLVRDDGAIVYLNGVEVFRTNMPAGAATFTTWSAAIVDGAAEYTPVSATIPTTALVAGTNLITVELHQRDGTSSDLGFALQLTATTLPPVVPEAPLTILLPLLGLATVAGAVTLRRRAVI